MRAQSDLGLVTKAGLAARVWVAFAAVAAALRARPLPEAVAHLGTPPRRREERFDPLRLSRIVHRVLRVGRWQPRCLFRALVLFRLLRLQGDEPVLVIGLPSSPNTKDAHAWVEIDGRDVGPPPGRQEHVELARYR